MSYQYRITINGTELEVIDALPSSWPHIAQGVEDRGGIAILERRLIGEADECWLKGLRDATGQLPAGYMVLNSTLICAWEVLAEVESR